MPEEFTDIRPSVWADGDFIQYTEDGKMNKRSIDYDLGSLMWVGLPTQPQESQTDFNWVGELAPQPLTEADNCLILELLAQDCWRSKQKRFQMKKERFGSLLVLITCCINKTCQLQSVCSSIHAADPPSVEIGWA